MTDSYAGRKGGSFTVLSCFFLVWEASDGMVAGRDDIFVGETRHIVPSAIDGLQAHVAHGKLTSAGALLMLRVGFVDMFLCG
ncbi:hypothetical protein M758_4G266400 [Ceratodon purpureus]|nr:hypothetical protein M758_4G266400 [Ceratodon purpureus]